MSRWIALGVVPIFTAVLGLGPASAQQPAPADGGVVIGLNRPVHSVRTGSFDSAGANRAALAGLHGPVHTVQEESRVYQKASSGAQSGSRYLVYDEKGYLLEDSRYDAGGTLMLHTKYTRDELGRVLKQETTGNGPGPTGTRVQTFDNNGLSRTESYDSNGAERDKTQIHTSAAGETTFTMQAKNDDGSTSEFRSMETTDPATGTKHLTALKDGKAEADTLIQQNSKGETQSKAMLFFDGTSIQSETLPDGSVKTHFYHPPTKTNIYKTTDKHHRLLEQVDDGPDGYTKTTYQYDEEGRVTEIATFNRSGTMIGKEAMKYQVDSFGNWTEKKSLGWDPKMTSKSDQLLSITKRVISYY